VDKEEGERKKKKIKIKKNCVPFSKFSLTLYQVMTTTLPIVT